MFRACRRNELSSLLYALFQSPPPKRNMMESMGVGFVPGCDTRVKKKIRELFQ